MTEHPRPRYVGHRADRAFIEVLEGAGPRLLAPGRPAEQPDWGYEGTGPLHAARLILADRLGEPPLEQMAMAFVDEVIAELSPRGFELTFGAVDEWLGRYRSRPEYQRAVQDELLGVLLRDGRAREQIGELGLESDDFLGEGARAVFGTIAALMRRGLSVTVSSLHDELGTDRVGLEHLDYLRRGTTADQPGVRVLASRLRSCADARRRGSSG
jgi:hypothetical protein